MNSGMMFISEDDLDELVASLDQTIDSDDMVSGRNIKTGCCGLFLCGLDYSLDLIDREQLQLGLDLIEGIPDDVVFNALSMHYPPVDLSLTGILRLLWAVLLLDGAPAHDDTYDTIHKVIDRLFNNDMRNKDEK